MKHLWSWKTLETDIGKIVEGGEQLDILDKVIGRKWNNITKDELEVLFYEKELTIEQIAELFQVKESSVVHKLNKTSVYKGYKQDKIEMRGDRAEMSDFPLYLNTVAGGLDCRDQTIGGFSFVVKIYAVPVVEIIG